MEKIKLKEGEALAKALIWRD